MPGMASAEELLDRLFDEGMNGNNDGVIDEVLHEDYRNHSFSAHGRAGMKNVVGDFRRAFTDMHITIEDRVVDGDRVAQRGHFTGKHTDAFMGVIASGREVTIPFMDWWAIRDGLLADNWVVMDVGQLVER
jgi:predicted ester cyclase